MAVCEEISLHQSLHIACNFASAWLRYIYSLDWLDTTCFDKSGTKPDTQSSKSISGLVRLTGCDAVVVGCCVAEVVGGASEIAY